MASLKSKKGHVVFFFVILLLMDGARIIQLPKIPDRRGNLSVIETGPEGVPFDIARAYWIYDVPGGECRGGHAFRRNRELIVALSGSLEVLVDDGTRRESFRLSRSYYGLYVPAGLWREMRDFSTNAVVMVLASEPYDRDDYVEDYDEYLKLRV